jgi:TetR/AcrR family transcriptional regulator
MGSPASLTRRGSRTRGLILDAAEGLFAERGFDATRLEDVAERVGIRRASIVYHFRDKRELYDAVLASVFGDFRERLAGVLETDGPWPGRAEAAIAAWVDYVGARPSLARILLREVASATPAAPPALLAHIAPFFELIERVTAPLRGGPAPPIDPVHLASTIAGATVFFVAAMPALIPGLGFDPLRPDQLESHKREVLRIARRLLARDAERPRPPPRTGRGAERREERR